MTVFKTLFFFLFLVSMVNAVSLVNSNQLANVQSNLQSRIDLKPNFQSVTDTVNQAIQAIPVAVEQDPVWTADKPSYVTTTALEQAIALIPVPVIPSYDNSKIISVDSNHFVTVSTVTNLVMYELLFTVIPSQWHFMCPTLNINAVMETVYPLTAQYFSFSNNGYDFNYGCEDYGDGNVTPSVYNDIMGVNWSTYNVPATSTNIIFESGYPESYMTYVAGFTTTVTNALRTYASVAELNQAISDIGINADGLQAQINALNTTVNGLASIALVQASTNGIVKSVEINTIKVMTQAAYDALTPKLSTTLYLTK